MNHLAACGVFSKVILLGPLSGWAAAEEQLRERGLVHADKCLHIEGHVTSIV